MHEINTDILIIGGGSAGISAAVGASQFGNKVTLIEQLSYLGGKATSAEVGTVCGLYKYSKTEKAEYIVKGFAKDFAEQLSELSQTVPLNNNNGLHYLPYNIEAYKDLCLDIIKKNNVELFLNSEVIHVQISNQHLKSVTIKTATEVFEINYKTIVDCSGNGQISQLTNLPLITSDKYQAAAQIFTLSGINDITETNLNFIVMKELQKAVYDKTLNNSFERISIVQGSVKNNMVSFKLGIPIEVTFQENNVMLLREKAIEMIQTFLNYFTETVPLFKNASLQSIAPEVGIRVGMRSTGNYILNEEDVLGGRKFNSAIANCSWPIEEWVQDKRVKLRYFNLEDFYQIPADCLKSINVTNLYFAGGNISATDGAIASARVMGICLQTGFAAGELAAGQVANELEINVIKAIQLKQINT
jgi:hypothetical protein